MKNKIKACIFDLDGTLLDTPRGVAYHLNEVLSREGLGSISVESVRAILGNGARNLVNRACALVGVTDSEKIENIYRLYNEHYDASPDSLVEVYDGVRELIAALSGLGIRLAVLSNKPHYATKVLVERYFGDSFDIVIGGRDDIPLKPAPDGVLHITDSLGISVSECAYVGDSEPDVDTAKNAKIGLPIMVLWGLRSREQLEAVGAKNFAHSAGDVLDIIKGENEA